MFELTTVGWALVVLSALFVGLTKTAISGLGLLTVIMMAIVFPAKTSTGIVLPMLIFGDIFAVLFYRRHGNARVLCRLLPFAVAGVLVGYFFMGRINNLQLRRIIGWIVVLMIGLNFLLKLRKEGLKAHGLAVAAPTGIFAGFTTMIANAAGPVMTVYLVAMDVKKEEFVGNMAWFFAVINLFKVPFSVGLGLVTPETLRFNLVLFPIVLASAVGGYFLLKVISQKFFDISVQALAAASAVYLIAA
jgi:uncharacterized protein